MLQPGYQAERQPTSLEELGLARMARLSVGADGGEFEDDEELSQADNQLDAYDLDDPFIDDDTYEPSQASGSEEEAVETDEEEGSVTPSSRLEILAFTSLNPRSTRLELLAHIEAFDLPEPPSRLSKPQLLRFVQEYYNWTLFYNGRPPSLPLWADNNRIILNYRPDL